MTIKSYLLIFIINNQCIDYCFVKSRKRMIFYVLSIKKTYLIRIHLYFYNWWTKAAPNTTPKNTPNKDQTDHTSSIHSTPTDNKVQVNGNHKTIRKHHSLLRVNAILVRILRELTADTKVAVGVSDYWRG